MYSWIYGGLKGENMAKKKVVQWPARCPIDKQGWANLQQLYKLTPRELQVCYGICRGMSFKEISSHLKIAVPTIKMHLKNAYLRIGVNNKIMMLLRFLENAGMKKEKLN